MFVKEKSVTGKSDEFFRLPFADTEAYSVSCAATMLLCCWQQLKGSQKQVSNSSFFLVLLDWNESAIPDVSDSNLAINKTFRTI